MLSDALRELLDLAVLSVSKRVNYAVGEAAKARAETERIAADGVEQLEVIFANNDEARLAARALLTQSLRYTGKLRQVRVAWHGMVGGARRECPLTVPDIPSDSEDVC